MVYTSSVSVCHRAVRVVCQCQSGQRPCGHCGAAARAARSVTAGASAVCVCVCVRACVCVCVPDCACAAMSDGSSRWVESISY